MDVKKVFITGGAGFIGSHVVDACLEKGFEVTVYDNFSVGRREHLAQHPSLSLEEGDILDVDRFAEAIRKAQPTHVFHLAAIHFIPYCIAHPLETIDVNIKGTEQVFQALATLPEGQLRKVVIASSAAVYAPSDDLHAEGVSAVGPTDIYGFSKQANETQAALFAGKSGVPTLAARIFNAYGPRETNPHLIPEIVRQLLAGETTVQLGNVTTKRSYIFVKDIASALVSLLDTDTQGFDCYNVGSHAEYNAQEVVELLGQAIGKDIEIQSVSSRQRASDRPHLQPSLKKIEEATGWREEYAMPRGLAEILSYPT